MINMKPKHRPVHHFDFDSVTMRSERRRVHWKSEGKQRKILIVLNNVVCIDVQQAVLLYHSS